MAFQISDLLRSTVVIGLLPPMNISTDVLRDSRKIREHIADLLSSTHSDIWCIYDFSEIDVQFDDLVIMFIDQSREKVGSFSDPRVQVVGVVYDKTMVNKLNVFLKRYEWEMPLFEHFDDAFDYVDKQIEVETMLRTLNLA